MSHPFLLWAKASCRIIAAEFQEKKTDWQQSSLRYTIQLIAWFVLLTFIHCIAIYPAFEQLGPDKLLLSVEVLTAQTTPSTGW